MAAPAPCRRCATAALGRLHTDASGKQASRIGFVAATFSQEGRETMATATQLREAFVKELHREGMKFELLSEEENIVVVPVKTRGAKFIVFVDFDEDGDEADTVNFVEPSIARVVDAAKIPEIIVKLNQVNSDYRFAKCYLNDARE
ncbi:MAG: hypothetical protein V8T51_02360 [Senegalimassilia faecalis]